MQVSQKVEKISRATVLAEGIETPELSAHRDENGEVTDSRSVLNLLGIRQEWERLRSEANISEPRKESRFDAPAC